jgi:hypothetical protein
VLKNLYEEGFAFCAGWIDFMVAVFLVFTHVLCHGCVDVSFSRCTSILSFDIILYLLHFFVLICNGQET